MLYDSPFFINCVNWGGVVSLVFVKLDRIY